MPRTAPVPAPVLDRASSPSKTITQKSESLIFYGIAKILIDQWVLEKNETNFDYGEF